MMTSQQIQYGMTAILKIVFWLYLDIFSPD